MAKSDSIQQESDAVVSLPVPPEKKASDYLDAYKNWSYAAIRHIGTTFAEVPINLYKRTVKGGEVEIEKVPEHESLSTLDYVNDFMTFTQLKLSYITYRYLLGEAAWALIRDGDTIREIWPLRPDWIKVIPSKKDYISHYEYSPGGSFKSVRVETQDMMFFKDFSPKNPYRGFGYVRAGAMPLDIDEFSDEYNRNFYYNSAIPYMFLMTDKKVQPETAKRIIEGFQDRFGGRRNSNKVALLTGGDWKIQTEGGKARELDFLESKKYIRDEILAIYGISKANIGVVEDVNRANQEASDARFMKTVIKPLLSEFVGFLNEFYLSKWNVSEDLFYNYEDPVPEDVESQLKIYESGLKYGWLTPNEVRLERGLEPLEGGDDIYKPVTVVNPQNNEEEEKLVSLKGKRPEKKDKLGAPLPVKSPKVLQREGQVKEFKHDMLKLVTKLSESYEDRTDEERTKEMKEAHWKEFVANTDIWEAAMAQLLRELIAVQKNVVIEKVQEEVKKKNFELVRKQVDGRRFIFNSRSENVRWYKDLEPYVERIIREQGERTLYDYGFREAFDTTAEEIQLYLDDVVYDFIKSINATTRKELIDALSLGLQEGEGIADLIARINEVYDLYDQYRLEQIVRSEVLRGANFATEQAYIQSGVVVAKEWLTAIDERVCSWCAEMDGTVVSVEGNFFDQGDTYTVTDPNTGKDKTLKLDFSDTSHPPLHPHCRCTLVPITISQFRSMEHMEDKERINEVYKDVEQKIHEGELKKVEKKKEKVEKDVKSAEIKKDMVEKATKEKAKEIKQEAEKKIEKEKQDILSDIRELRDKMRDTVYYDGEDKKGG